MTGGGVVYGGWVLAATVAGAVALFAPCCISVLLPAYFASSFHNRRLLVAMTFLFAAGVATVVLPIALGAAVVQRLLVGRHTLVWLAGGALLLGLGGYTLAGGQLRLPMPGRSAQPPAVYRTGSTPPPRRAERWPATVGSCSRRGVFLDGEPFCYGRLSERRLRREFDRLRHATQG